MILLASLALAQEPTPTLVIDEPTVFEVPPPAPEVTVLTPRQAPVIEVEVEIEVPENVGIRALR